MRKTEVLPKTIVSGGLIMLEI